VKTGELIIIDKLNCIRQETTCDKEACKFCIYWRDKTFSIEDDKHIAKCKRYPPQLNTFEDGIRFNAGEAGAEAERFCWYQPVTYDDDWCGEFKPKKAVEK
jgi:hypothetical protein